MIHGKGRAREYDGTDLDEELRALERLGIRCSVSYRRGIIKKTELGLISIGMGKSYTNHMLVYIGNGKMIDPYDGKVKLTRWWEDAFYRMIRIEE